MQQRVDTVINKIVVFCILEIDFDVSIIVQPDR